MKISVSYTAFDEPPRLSYDSKKDLRVVACSKENIYSREDLVELFTVGGELLWNLACFELTDGRDRFSRLQSWHDCIRVSRGSRDSSCQT